MKITNFSVIIFVMILITGNGIAIADSGFRCQAMDLAESGNPEVTREVEIHYSANSMSFHYFEGIDNPSVGKVFAGSLAMVGKTFNFRGGELWIRMDNHPVETSFVKGRPIGKISAFTDSQKGLTLKITGGTHTLPTPNTHIFFSEITSETSTSKNQLEVSKRIQMNLTLAPPNEPESHWTSATEWFDKCQVFGPK